MGGVVIILYFHPNRRNLKISLTSAEIPFACNSWLSPTLLPDVGERMCFMSLLCWTTNDLPNAPSLFCWAFLAITCHLNVKSSPPTATLAATLAAFLCTLLSVSLFISFACTVHIQHIQTRIEFSRFQRSRIPIYMEQLNGHPLNRHLNFLF